MLGYVWPVVEELRGKPREEWPAPDALADALTELAEYFEEAGWDDFALRTHHEVLEFRRELGDPAKLRVVLTSLRDNLKRQERYEEALVVVQEELPLALRLAVPGERSTGIANTARYWITNFLGRLGRHAEAAENAREAVAELDGQELVPHSLPGYDLAHAWLEYAHRLAAIGEYDQAAEFTALNAAFWRDHGSGRNINGHSAFEELCLLQLRLGRFGDARVSADEAVAVLRKHADEEGDRQSLDDLAGGVHNHGNRLHDLGFFAEAVEAAQESADRYRALLAGAERRAVVMRAELRLAAALVSLGSRLHDEGRLGESLAANDEAIALATKHDEREIGSKELARAFNSRASLLITRGEYPEAAEAAAKSIDLYQTADGKAMARNTFALAAARAGSLDAALPASSQAVAHYREQHARDPYEYGYLLADALTDHAVVRSLRSERAEAEAAITESLARNEELAAFHPARYQRELDHARSVAARV
ncbi:hypothetical protein DFR72_101795 [Lentzea flaviverrucosa]|uniref:Tetratricopeptide repeat-containing protein n=2 Tax=Lentzea flaviverrucosa TaxID=200379 RepID=A0A1H9G0M9_9PSEU|nr:hypothetical protein DFR72_101795 [Lentzea flaviverrucosa]SEQ43705.1 hypothetical protein SAMN05216195_102422 [Lentzea flaviverrucosa]